MSTLNQYKISGIPQDKDIRQLIDKLIVVLSMIPARKFFKAIAFIAPMKKLIILRKSTILSEENKIKINAQIVDDRLEAIINTAIFSELISKKAEKLLSE
ncbi:hypothetical protein I3271_09350 [Photobacterium leiognathi]|uniref:hypothetical protein n=1 Tax=Photobacterium leiognathi TaxID=553611 RepID=UPI001EDE0847|nr:hypothetical protein [Photobacterium leiognathi]MCG3884893.1 hypothetical protein [Photobacterium leiognathi]